MLSGAPIRELGLARLDFGKVETIVAVTSYGEDNKTVVAFVLLRCQVSPSLGNYLGMMSSFDCSKRFGYCLGAHTYLGCCSRSWEFCCRVPTGQAVCGLRSASAGERVVGTGL